jgi:hypothetical protein
MKNTAFPIARVFRNVGLDVIETEGTEGER